MQFKKIELKKIKLSGYHIFYLESKYDFNVHFIVFLKSLRIYTRKVVTQRSYKSCKEFELFVYVLQFYKNLQWKIL